LMWPAKPLLSLWPDRFFSPAVWGAQYMGTIREGGRNHRATLLLLYIDEGDSKRIQCSLRREHWNFYFT
jgi:hypothetical protein